MNYEDRYKIRRDVPPRETKTPSEAIVDTPHYKVVPSEHGFRMVLTTDPPKTQEPNILDEWLDKPGALDPPPWSDRSDGLADDPVCPAHYTDYKIQPIEAIEDWDLDFHLGCVVKYIARHIDHDGLTDLKKALWYLEREIALWEEDEKV